jgi:putative membrane protein
MRRFVFVVMIIAFGCGTTPAMATSDRLFLSDAIEANNSIVSLGELAAKKGGGDGVRSFAQKLVDDHIKAKDEATALAVGLEVKITGVMTDEARSEVEKL